MFKLKSIVIWALLSLLALAASPLTGFEVAAETRPRPGRDRYLVGAYYYLWYPRNFGQGYLRAKLKPPQKPLLGPYDSKNPAVIEDHIAMCSRYGVDFLALSWWPGRREQNRIVTEAFLKAPNIGDIKWCLFYETYAINWQPRFGATVFTKAAAERLTAEVVRLADEYFDHPSYLKIDGRPVIIFYLTRTFIGDYVRAFERLRAELKKRGHDPFIIGDEVFWAVASQKMAGRLKSDGGRIEPRLTIAREPQTARIGLFDAITAYNMYEGGMVEHAGYGAESSFVRDVVAVYKRYMAAAPQVGFIPNILPGYNDRGHRPDQDHFAIPRRWRKGAAEGSFLAESFDRIAFPCLDPRLNMILITSFNEWNEDSAIEPVRPAKPTAEDISPSGRLYTQGYVYEGYGWTYLEVIRDKVVAVAGRVTDRNGRAAAGATVCAFKDGRPLACDTADAKGYYTLSRLRLPPGRYRVGLLGSDERRPVLVDGRRSAQVELVRPGE